MRPATSRAEANGFSEATVSLVATSAVAAEGDWAAGAVRARDGFGADLDAATLGFEAGRGGPSVRAEVLSLRTGADRGGEVFSGCAARRTFASRALGAVFFVCFARVFPDFSAKAQFSYYTEKQ